MKIIIGVILIVIILVIGGFVYIVGSDTGVIPPFDGDEDSNPDSGNGADENDVSFEMKITTPVEDYLIPETGCPIGKFRSVYVEGVVYGLDANWLEYVEFRWDNGIDYGFNRVFESMGAIEQLDQYNYKFHTNMEIQRLGTGNHLLTAKSFNSANEFLAEASIMFTIPEKWIFEWDSRSPPDPGEICYERGSYYYKFGMPYENNEDGFSWLRGNIIKIIGSFDVTCGSGVKHVFNLNLWNTETEQWTTVNTFEAGPDGWYNIEVDCGNTWGNWISFAGYGDGSDDIRNFVGEVWIVPGTQYYTLNPLEIFTSFIWHDDFNNPPSVT